MSDKRAGRPRADQPSSTVCAWVPSVQHDRLIAIAKQERTSVSKIVTRMIAQAVLRPSKSA